jgi:integral membrane protein
MFDHDFGPRRTSNTVMTLGVPASPVAAVGCFRIIAFWEGVSFLVLLFVAMPLKYGFGVGAAVVVGMAHGVLFIGYCATLALAAPRLGTRRSVLLLSLCRVGHSGWRSSCRGTSASSTAAA